MYTKNEELTIIFIFNNHDVVWHAMDGNCTISDIFQELKDKFNIKKCMLDIEQHTFVKPVNLLLKPILHKGIGCDIHVTYAKD